MSEIQDVNYVNYVNYLCCLCICIARQTKQMAYLGGKLTKLTILTGGIGGFLAEIWSKRGVRGDGKPKITGVMTKNCELYELLLIRGGSRTIFVMGESLISRRFC